MASDPTRRFTGRAEAYALHRPDYPPFVVETLRARCGLTPASVVADVGCGTGMLARHLVDLGCFVYGVEPNEEMWAKAHAELGHRRKFVAVLAGAEDTALPPASVDLITAAQAFHWFEPVATAREWRRILRPGGAVAVVWNVRREAGTPFLEGYERLLQVHGLDYAEVQAQPLALRGFLGSAAFEEASTAYHQDLDWEGLYGRAVSTSYLPSPGHPGHEAFRRDLRALFEACAVDGRVRMQYHTQLYLGRFSPLQDREDESGEMMSRDTV